MENFLKTLPVLVIEDDEGFNFLIKKTLIPLGYTVKQAYTGQEAIAVVEEDKNLLLLMDYHLPDLKGREIIEKIHSMGIHPPFVVMTGNGDEKIAVDMMKNGAMDYIIKDLNFIDILPHVLGRVINEIEKEKKLSRTQDALVKSESRYQEIADLLPQAVFELSADGKFIFTNRHWFDFFEYTQEDLSKGVYLRDLVSDEQKEQLKNALEKLISDVEVLSEEYLLITKKGGRIPVILYLQSTFNHKTHEGYRGIAMNIIERKKSEEALKESEQYYRSLIENSNDVISILSPEGDIVYESPSHEHVLGYKNSELLGKNVFVYVHPDDRQNILAQFENLLKNPGGLEDVSFRFLHKDGIYRYLEGIGQNLIYDSSIGGIVVNYRDVTEKKMAQEALKETNIIFKALITSSPIGILVIDMNKDVVMWNPRAQEIFNWGGDNEKTAESLFPISSLDKQEIFEEIINLHWDEMVSYKILNKELNFKMKKKGQVNISLSSAPLVGQNGDIIGVVNMLQDISRRKEVETQLFQAQKMDSIGHLAGGIAHDFNNLLTIISGYCELILFEENPTDRMKESVTEILEASKKASSLTSQLLVFSRKQVLQVKSMDINQQIRQLSKMLSRLIGEDIKLEMEFDSTVRLIKADPGQIDQIIMNLAVNARDAMPEGGQLKIQTKNVDIDKDYVLSNPEAREGEYVLMVVSDTGIGIEEETLRHIFEPFFTTKNVGEGTGLGLSVIYGAVKQHQGWVTVDSKMGDGTAFKVYFPALSATSNLQQNNLNTNNHFKGNNETILVVEDEATLRNMAETILTKNGYQVTIAENKNSAVKILKENKGNFDLLFSDIVLTDGSGLDLAGFVKKKYPDMKILLTSGYAGKKARADAVSEGGFQFIRKPYSLNDLLKMIHNIVKK